MPASNRHTWNKAAVVRDIADTEGVPHAIVTRVLDHTFKLIESAAYAGERIVIRGFGAFEPRRKVSVARTIPKGVGVWSVPAKLTVVFVASPILKSHLNPEGVASVPVTRSGEAL